MSTPEKPRWIDSLLTVVASVLFAAVTAAWTVAATTTAANEKARANEQQIIELKARQDRLEGKVDAILSGQSRLEGLILQMQAEQRILHRSQLGALGLGSGAR